MKLKTTVTTSGKGANKKLIWKSLNTEYAVVDKNGKVTALPAGKGNKVILTVRTTDGTSKMKYVRIKIK